MTFWQVKLVSSQLLREDFWCKDDPTPDFTDSIAMITVTDDSGLSHINPAGTFRYDRSVFAIFDLLCPTTW
jgi:hypothetical protein